jgi:predicted TIM-barrel fold metal-dependent hydrolase
MASDGVIDACVHQWTLDPAKMKNIVPEQWKKKMAIKAKVDDVAATLVPAIPWYHAYWNEDSPTYERPDSGTYTNAEQYRNPEALDRHLAERGVDTALLMGHEIKFLPAIMNPELAGVVASAYNELLVTEWLPESDRFKGAVVAAMSNPEAAIEEITTYADHPDVVSVLLFGGGEHSFGHPFYRPIFRKIAEAGLPLTVCTSGNPVHRQTAMGIPEHYVTFDTMLSQNHMTNMASMIFQGLFDDYPELDIVWAGEGIGWHFLTMWRATRYYRNLEPQVPQMLTKEPHEYVTDNFYFTTHPLGSIDEEITEDLFELTGFDSVLFGSGYPHWNADKLEDLPTIESSEYDKITHENAKQVYGI